MTTLLASAADARYGYWLLNMVGSVHANSPRTFDGIVLYDLGLTPFQRRLARSIRGAELRTVPPFVRHWREGRTWKTWIWTHVEADNLLWLDAGLTVLRPLNESIRQIATLGYFAVSQGHPIADSIPSDYYERFGFPRERADRVSVAAGIFGFRVGSDFYQRVVVPTYEDARRGLSVGFSRAEATKMNVGLDRTDAPVIRDCALFRHEQTLLNIHFHRELGQPTIHDVYEYGGWQSPYDHPRQVIWSHRRRGDYGSIGRVRYVGGAAALGRAFSMLFRANWWRRNHTWVFRPATYLRKLKAMSGALLQR
jgi:hypothetical protein